MKVWHMICEVCGRHGPEHENPIEAVRLAEHQGWGSLEIGWFTLNVCAECRRNREQALHTWQHKGKPMHATVVQSAA